MRHAGPLIPSSHSNRPPSRSVRGPLALVAALLALWLWPTSGQAATLCVHPAGGGCFTTIQAAINAATTGDTIDIAPATYPENLFIVDKSLTLTGIDGAASTIVDGSAATVPVVDVNSTASDYLIVNGMTFTNGTAPTGGGFNVSGVSLTLNYSVVTGSTATSQGGGIWTDFELTINDSTISANTSSNDAGGIYAKSMVTITRSYVRDNTAAGRGGGLEILSGLHWHGGALSGNTATFGGGIYSHGGILGMR
jgi:hypothetical protein